MKIFRTILRSCLLTMLLVLSASVFGSNNADNVRIEIESPSEVLLDEDFLVRYHIVIAEYTDDLPEPEIGKFTDFEVISGPRKQVSITRGFWGDPQSINLIITYRLRPRKAGSYNLPQTKYQMYGKTYKSDKFKVDVIDNNSQKRKIEELKDGEAFIRNIVSRQNISPSDTLIITYRLYSTVPIYGIEGFYKFPLPSRDFNLNDLTNYKPRERKETYEGKEYFVRDIRVLLLQPRNEGRKVVAGGTVEMIYTAKTGRKLRNRHGQIVDEVVYLKKELKIEDITISVMNLIVV